MVWVPEDDFVPCSFDEEPADADNIPCFTVGRGKKRQPFHELRLPQRAFQRSVGRGRGRGSQKVKSDDRPGCSKTEPKASISFLDQWLNAGTNKVTFAQPGDTAPELPHVSPPTPRWLTKPPNVDSFMSLMDAVPMKGRDKGDRASSHTSKSDQGTSNTNTALKKLMLRDAALKQQGINPLHYAKDSSPPSKSESEEEAFPALESLPTRSPTSGTVSTPPKPNVRRPSRSVRKKHESSVPDTASEHKSQDVTSSELSTNGTPQREGANTNDQEKTLVIEKTVSASSPAKGDSQLITSAEATDASEPCGDVRTEEPEPADQSDKKSRSSSPPQDGLDLLVTVENLPDDTSLTDFTSLAFIYGDVHTAKILVGSQPRTGQVRFYHRSSAEQLVAMDGAQAFIDSDNILRVWSEEKPLEDQ